MATPAPTVASPSPAPAADDPRQRPSVHLLPGMSRRLRRGHPWLFSNEIDMTAGAKGLPPGGLVTIIDAGGERLGTGTFNPHSLIAVRLFTRDPDRAIDAAFLGERLSAALALRDTLYGTPYYRLAHSEADGLPGLVIDRYGDVLVVQTNSAGMERLQAPLLEALTALLTPATVVLRNDSPVRALEGLDAYHAVAIGSLTAPATVEEEGVRFLADLSHGQKTGWFYDQRDNRSFAARLSVGRRVLDLYTYTGGFAVRAAVAGAASVLGIDRSESALALAESASRLNGVAERCRFVRAEVFAETARLEQAGERFGMVVCDPPAFVKAKKELAVGLKGYRKLTRSAAALVEARGFLVMASCSHHVTMDAFAEEVSRGLALTGRSGRVLRAAGAGPDHPIHPALPESAYLKVLVLQVD